MHSMIDIAYIQACQFPKFMCNMYAVYLTYICLPNSSGFPVFPLLVLMLQSFKCQCTWKCTGRRPGFLCFIRFFLRSLTRARLNNRSQLQRSPAVRLESLTRYCSLGQFSLLLADVS